MARTRQEEHQTLQELGLLRDERDRELGKTAQAAAYPLLVSVSQVLAAACLLRGEPAWAALLSLTFLGWAVQGAGRFLADGKRLYLGAAVLSGGAALALWVWFLTHAQEETSFSLGRLVAFAALSAVLIALAGLVFLALFLAFVFVKGQVGRMDGDKWDRYFQSIPTLGLLVRLYTLAGLAMALVSIVSIPLLQVLGFPTPERLSLVLLSAGLFHLMRAQERRREELLRLLLRLKPAA